MFSGIVETTQRVRETRLIGSCVRVRIEKPKNWRLSLGESVTVDGICSTVVAARGNSFEVEYMPETLGKTTAAEFQADTAVNLERSLKYGDRIHGHVVTGHVDARVQVVDVQPEGRSRITTFSLPDAVSRLVVPRGSVAVNGVSLTVARVRKQSGKGRHTFSVALIPHTIQRTNLGKMQPGDAANLECDVIARYGLAVVAGSARVTGNERRKSKKGARRRLGP